MATKPKAILSTHDGREVSPITRTSNVLFENGQTAQDILNDRQDAMISPVIENSSSMFKVGQGDDVDYSANVVNGAYEGMVLKGKTMVNCIQESSSQDVVLPYEFEDGQYVTINDTKESGALGVELKGQTLVNLINSYTINAPVGQTKNWYASSYATGNVKAGKYMLIYNLVKTSKTKRNTPRIRLANDGYLYHGFDNFNTTPGIKKWIFTADSDLIEFTYWITDNEGDIIVNDFILLEYQEGMENWDIPYFEGMQSVRMPVLTTTGKNLFDKEAFYNDWKGKQAKYIYKETVDGEDVLKIHNLNLLNADKNGFKIFVKKDVPLTLTFKCKKAGTADTNAVLTVRHDYKTYKDVGSCNSDVWTERSATFTPTRNYITICSAYIQNDYYYIKDIQLEQGTQKTPYEPYKSSILSLPEEVVLRSLPNGVCDTFNTRTGVYTQRIGEVVLDGSDSAKDWMFSESNNTFRTSFNKHGIIPFQGNRFVHVISDKYTTLVYKDDWNSGAFVSMDTYNRVVFRDDRFSSLIDWHNSLKQDAITVQYILETPIVTKINLPSTLKSWNTTTHIYSEIPENTLYPILSHSNPSYPVILKPSTKYSIVANSYSNDHANSAINFNLGGATASTTVGNRVTTITTPSTLTSEELVMSGRGNKLNNVMVIEGDVAGDVPYFEGICDCKSPILSNVGKNLFDQSQDIIKPSNPSSTNTYFYDKLTNTSEVSSTNWSGFYKHPIKTVVGETYYCYSEVTWGAHINIGTHENVISGSDNNNDSIYQPRMGSFVAISDVTYVTYGFRTTNRKGYVRNVMVSRSPISKYEPYKSNILSCETYFDETTQSDKTIVLRSLPNGVCDTLNVETGEYVQRIGEVVLDGTETNWSVTNEAGWENTPNTIAFGLTFTPKALAYATDVTSSVVCDKFSTITADGTWGASGADKEGISINQNSRFDIRIERTKLPDESLTGFKQWLSQNPITVQYELEVPIVKTVDLSGFPFSYENGHVQLSSGSIEQSLTPKVEYSVATNRNGQIRSNQKMVERHQKQLDQLQAIILANLVNSQYNQTLTTLKYELSRV